jgi:hypothetical protein
MPAERLVQRAGVASYARGARVVVESATAFAGFALGALAWRADRPWWEAHVLDLRCATQPWELSVATVARIAALAIGAALVLFARPRLGRGVERDPRRALGVTIRVGAAAVLALVFSEALLRGKTQPVPRPDVPETRADPHLGRVLAPSRTTETVRGGRSISFAVNALGLRVRTENEMPDLSRPSILVVGESIAEGYAVPYDESPSYLIEKATGIPTLNAAVSGYANDQVYRRMNEILERLERPLAVVTFVVPLQIQRNVDYRRERLALLADGSLAVVLPAPKFVRDVRLFELFDRVAPRDDTAFRIARAILIATARDARARGAFPLFVATNFRSPCLHDESGQSSLAHRLFAGLDLPYVSVDLDPRWAVPGDGHPDVRGSRALAEAIVTELSAHKNGE